MDPTDSFDGERFSFESLPRSRSFDLDETFSLLCTFNSIFDDLARIKMVLT